MTKIIAGIKFGLMLGERGCGNQGEVVTIVPVNGGLNHQEYLCNSPENNIGYKGKDTGGKTVKYCGKMPFLIPSCAGFCPFKQKSEPETRQTA